MPEVFVVVIVVAISIAAYVSGVIRSRDRSLRTPQRELERLHRQAVWLEQRLDQARREKWGLQMAARISEELGETLRRMARLKAKRAGGVVLEDEAGRMV